MAPKIANMDTPNYKAFELVITEEMNKHKGFVPGFRLVQTHAGHFSTKNNRADNVKLKAAEPRHSV